MLEFDVLPWRRAYSSEHFGGRCVKHFSRDYQSTHGIITPMSRSKMYFTAEDFVTLFIDI